MKSSPQHLNLLSRNSLIIISVVPSIAARCALLRLSNGALRKNQKAATCSNAMKALILSIILMILPQGTFAMSIFNPTKTCVFSEVKARLALNGEPLSNVRVTRQWEWHKRRSDEAITDAEGYVTFPPVYESSVTRLLPAEIVIGQRLSVELKDEVVIFWQNSKREAIENSEYGGSSFDVICELSDEKVLIEEYGSLMATMCKLEK
jgi:hypothetical protein